MNRMKELFSGVHFGSKNSKSPKKIIGVSKEKSVSSKSDGGHSQYGFNLNGYVGSNGITVIDTKGEKVKDIPLHPDDANLHNGNKQSVREKEIPGIYTTSSSLNNLPSHLQTQSQENLTKESPPMIYRDSNCTSRGKNLGGRGIPVLVPKMGVGMNGRNTPPVVTRRNIDVNRRNQFSKSWSFSDDFNVLKPAKSSRTKKNLLEKHRYSTGFDYNGVVGREIIDFSGFNPAENNVIKEETMNNDSTEDYLEPVPQMSDNSVNEDKVRTEHTKDTNGTSKTVETSEPIHFSPKLSEPFYENTRKLNGRSPTTHCKDNRIQHSESDSHYKVSPIEFDDDSIRNLQKNSLASPRSLQRHSIVMNGDIMRVTKYSAPPEHMGTLSPDFPLVKRRSKQSPKNAFYRHSYHGGISSSPRNNRLGCRSPHSFVPIQWFPSCAGFDWLDWNDKISKSITVRYIGSFNVVGEDQNERAEHVRKQLADMRNVEKSKGVLLVISLSGIKVCNSTGDSVYMAHALKRISYATCDPEASQFSFLAREPKGLSSSQYCHAFITKTPEEAEELNNIVGNAFKMAYTYQRQQNKPQPSFNDLIKQQIKEQKQQFEEHNAEQQKAFQKRLSQISTATVADRVKERKERRQREMEELEKQRQAEILAGKERTTWAKHIAGKQKHRSIIEDSSPSHHANQPNSPQLSTRNCDSPSIDVSAIKDVLDSKKFSTVRSYGSPVTMLKDTIDNHFNNLGDVKTTYNSPKNGSPLTIRHPTGNGESSDMNGSASNGESPSHLNMHSRPLPATPQERKRNDRKHSPQSQRNRSRSRSSSGQNRDNSSTESPRSSNGFNGLDLNKPVSAYYNNDSPLHPRSEGTSLNGFDETDSAGLYAGPPTPARCEETSGMIFYNRYLDRYDSLRKDPDNAIDVREDELKQPWYQAGLPREIALEILQQQEIGSFIVRDSSTQPGCYALSVKVPKYDNPTGMSHYLIVRTHNGTVRLKGLDKEWPSLTALVTHHTVMPEMLPCTLRLPRNSRNPAFRDSDKEDGKEEDEDYQKLSDCSTMMRELKMK